MSIRDFLENLQQRVLRLRTSVQKSQPGRLRVMSLEDRRLLDATAGFLAGQLVLDGFDVSENLTINEDVGGHLDFDLSSGKWGGISGSGLSLLNADQTLRIDAANVADLQRLDINAGDVALGGIDANAALNLDQLKIQNGGSVELGNLDISGDAAVVASLISDAAGSEISIGGVADFQADSITFGDNTADVTNFGSLTFVSTGDVSISEDSSTSIAGINSAANLTLASAGSITNASASVLNVSGTASFIGTSIELNDVGASKSNFGSVVFASVGDVTLHEASDLQVSASSSGANVSLVASGNIESSPGATLDATSLTLISTESLVSEGNIGSSGQNFQFDADVLSTSSDGDQFLAAAGATEIVSLQATDSSHLFDLDSSATVFLNDGDFTGTGSGVVGGLAVSDLVGLSTDAAIVDLQLSSTSEITFRIESTAADGGAALGSFDQWQVSDSVSLGGAALTIADQNQLADGTIITLIDNSGTAVAGTFAGLAEGDSVTGTSGQRYRISYVGGDGNDVQLTALTSTFSFAETASFVAEDVAGGVHEITVQRAGDQSAAASVVIQVAGGTAVQGSDFTASSTVNASFAAGAATATVSLSIVDDDVVEADESLTFTLVKPADGFLDSSASASTVTINNDDVTGLQFQLSSAVVNEGDAGTATVTYEVTSSHAVAGGFAIAVLSEDVQTAVGSDYTLQTNSLAFAGAANETQLVSVSIVGETLFEVDEAFLLKLGNVTASNSSIDVGTGFSVGGDLRVQITNDDTEGLAVLQSGQLTVSDETVAGQDNLWSIAFDSVANEVVVTSDQANLGTGAAVAVSELRFDAASITQGIVFEGRGGDDVLTVDFRDGNPIAGGGLKFAGGSETVGGRGDGLSVIGDGILTATYTPDVATFGDGLVAVGGQVIRFEGLEPIDVSGFSTATLNLPGASDVLTIEDSFDFFGSGTQAALRVSGTSGGVAIETVAFFNNDSLVINTVTSGADGIDQITIDSASSNHGNTNVLIDTGSTAGDQVRVNGLVAVDGDLSVTSTVVNVNAASVSAVGRQVLAGAVVVDQSVSLVGDSVTVIGSVDSASGELNSLTITGDAVLDGDVGGATALSSLSITGTTELDGNVTTSSQQSYGAALVLAGDSVLTSTANGSIQFQGAVDGSANLAVNTSGTTRFFEAVGATSGLTSLTTDVGGATTVSGRSITTTGIQSFGDSVVLTADTVLNASTVSLLGAASGGGHDLTINGNVNLQSNVGSLSSLDVTGTSVLNGDVVTSGHQDYRDSVSLAGDVSLTANGLQFHDTLDGDQLLTAIGRTGGVRFDAAVGSATALSGLNATGDSVAFDDTVQVDDEGLSVTSVAATSFASDVTSTGGGFVTLNNGGALSLASGTVFQLDGAFQQAGVGLVAAGADISTTGDAITFASAVSQTAAVAFRSTSSGNAAGANVSVQDVNSAGLNLTVDAGTGGSITTGSVSAVGQLMVQQSLSTTYGGTVTGTTVSIRDTVGAVTFADDLTATNLLTSSEDYSVRLLEDSTVTNAVVFLNSGGVTFGNGTDDVQAFDGGLTSVASFNSVQGTVQTSADNLTLGQTTLDDTTLLSTGTAAGDITVGQILGSGVALTANAGLGAVDLSDLTNIIGDLSITADEATVFEADDVTQTTAWTVANDVTVSAAGHDVILDNSGNRLGDITLIANNVRLSEAGDTTIDSVTAANSVLLSSTGAINDASVDSVTDVTAASVTFNAASGIGSLREIEVQTSTVSAITTRGAIDLLNSATTATSVQNLVTSVGRIDYVQTGTGDVAFDLVTNMSGRVSLASQASDLTIDGSVTAGSGDVAVVSTGGSIALDGVVTAAGRTVFVTSSGSVLGDSLNSSSDVVANRLVVSAANGIGVASPIETTVNELSVLTTGVGGTRIANSIGVMLLDSTVADDFELQIIAGDLTVAGTLNAAGQTVLLQSDTGRVVESGTGSIVAGLLAVNAATGIELDQATNNVDSFAAVSAVGDVVFREADGFQVTSVTAVGLFDGAAGVVSAGNGAINLSSIGGDIVVDAAIAADAGSIDVEASNGAVFVNQNVASNSGDISFTGNRIRLDTAVATAVNAKIQIVATDGEVSMSAASTVTTDMGSIVVSATDDVQVASLVSGTGDVFLTADSDGNLVGAITDANGAATNLATSGLADLTAATGIDVDTNLLSVAAAVTGTGDVSINESDSITLTNVSTANGSIVVDANGRLIATSVSSSNDASDSVALRTTAGGIVATDVAASGEITLSADRGDVEIVNVVSSNNGITVTADDGGIVLGRAVANSAAAVISLTASGDIVDSGVAAWNLSASDGTVTLVAANIGAAGSDVFKPTAADAVRIEADRLNLTATGADPDGVIAVDLKSDLRIDTLSGNHIFIQSESSVDLSSATPVANSLSIIADGNIVLPASVTVTDDLRLEAEQITSVPGPTIDLNATRILFVSASAADLSITASEFDGKTNGDLTVSSDSALLQLTDLNCDLTAIDTNGATATLNQTTGGRIVQQLPVDALQNSRILSDQLLLTGSGTFELTNGANNVSTLAADTNGTVAFTDVDSIAIGTVDGVSGITTGNQDLLIEVGESIQLQQQVDVGLADVRLAVGSAGVSGDIRQDSAGGITANELGVRNEAVAGSLVLAADNDVAIFAAANSAAGETIVFQDVNEVVVGSVSGQSVGDAVFAEANEIRSNDGDITIASGEAVTAANSVFLDAEINAGDAAVRLLVDGNVNQSVAGVIQADQLGVRQIGSVGDVILDDSNVVNELAIENVAVGGTIGFRNQQALTIGSIPSITVPASPNLSALQFAETSGLTTDDGTIQLSVADAVDGDGAIRVDQAVAAGDAAVALTSNGEITQAAAGTVSASDLLVQQQSEVAGVHVNLGTAGNDVSSVAVRNLSEGGDVLFDVVSDLSVDRVSVSAVGNLAATSFSGIDADAGDINVTASFDLNVNQDINAASDTSTVAIDETITLISRSGDFALADGTVISTDENPVAGASVEVTGDRINILAGTDGTGGVVDLGNPATIELRTDGGVARQIAPRPSGFTTAPTAGVESAFVTLTDAASSRRNLTFTEDGFLGEFDFVFGVAGEENLEVVVDFGVITLIDLTANGVASNAVQQPSGIFEFEDSDFTESVFQIGAGGERYQISHLYQTGDLVTTPNDRNGRQFNPNIIGVRFSVAQHESINVFGTGAVDPTSLGTVDTTSAFTGAAANVLDAAGNSISPTAAGLSLLTSTDTNGLRNLQAEASNDFPLQNLAITATGQPIGLAEFEFIAGPPPGIVRFVPTERFVADFPEVVAPIDATVISEISGDAFFGDGAASDAGVGTDVYLQIRRYFELDAPAEVVIARINDSELITSREAFEKFVAENAELQDGAGYEIWLVTETGGQQVERPVVQFEITGGRPGPATESVQDSNQPARLIDVEFQQADEFDQTDSAKRPQNDAAGNSVDGEQQQPEINIPVDGSNLQSAIDFGTAVVPDEMLSDATGGKETANRLLGNEATDGPGDDEASAAGLPDSELFDSSLADSSLADSTVVTAAAVSAFGAVSRFRSRGHSIAPTHSVASRTMKRLRNRSTTPKQNPGED